MKRWLPYPLLTAALLVMWLLLNGFTLGHLVLGGVIALLASLAMKPLEPAKPRIRRWDRIPVLLWRVMVDILGSNIAVALVILRGRRSGGGPGFVRIPLELSDRTGLAILACIITATPGTAWFEYHSGGSWLKIHVLDLVDEQQWIDHIKGYYETLLLEIFE